MIHTSRVMFCGDQSANNCCFLGVEVVKRALTVGVFLCIALECVGCHLEVSCREVVSVDLNG